MSKEVKLYEIEALLRCVTVVAATSRQDALKEVHSWRNAWVETGELIEVLENGPEVIDVRPLEELTRDRATDEAHAITAKAERLLSDE